jgi:mono/diheme cytochrome c family protein
MQRIIVAGIAATALLCSFQVKKNQQGGIKATIQRGKKVFDITCLACHQADGGGVPRMNPPLVKTRWVLGNKKELITIVLNGLPGGAIEIDGDDFHNNMPAQATALTNQQIADVLTYVRNSFGNKASAVTAAEVAAVRKGK